MLQRIKEIIQNGRVKKVKEDYTSDMLKIHRKAVSQMKKSQELLKKVEKTSTTYRLAVATGAKNRGLVI